MLNFKEFFYAQESTDYDVIYLYHSNKKIDEIVTITNKSVAEIYRILHRNDIMPNRMRPNHQGVVDFASSGLSVNQIAELTGYTPRNVRIILKKNEEQAINRRTCKN
jgi:hypothetical protein